MQNKYRFKFTKVAVSDIEKALEYISENLANPQAAKKLYFEIEKAIDNICSFPYAYADCSCYMVNDENIRHIKVGNYILIYEVLKSNSYVHILRFRYSMMDFANMDFK